MAASAAAAAPWKGMPGDKRILREFKYLQFQIQKGHEVQVYDLQLVDDIIRQWRFKLKNFDDDVPGGRQLNQDLAALATRHGLDHLLMEIKFPVDYPTRPFFLRVVKPRCCWYTGHVTAGGSICIEALTLSSSPSAWQPDYSVEAILRVVISNMIDAEVYPVRTATGPGGLAGPLRIDLDMRWHRTGVLTEYSQQEAESAFHRMQAHHQANGWGPPGSNAGRSNPSSAALTASTSQVAALVAKLTPQLAFSAVVSGALRPAGLGSNVVVTPAAPGSHAGGSVPSVQPPADASITSAGKRKATSIHLPAAGILTRRQRLLTASSPQTVWPATQPSLASRTAVLGSSQGNALTQPALTQQGNALTQPALTQQGNALTQPALTQQGNALTQPALAAVGIPVLHNIHPVFVTPAGGAGRNEVGGGRPVQPVEDNSDEESLSLSDLNVMVTDNGGVKRCGRAASRKGARGGADEGPSLTPPSTIALDTTPPKARSLLPFALSPISTSPTPSPASARVARSLPSPGHAHAHHQRLLRLTLSGHQKASSSKNPEIILPPSSAPPGDLTDPTAGPRSTNRQDAAGPSGNTSPALLAPAQTQSNTPAPASVLPDPSSAHPAPTQQPDGTQGAAQLPPDTQRPANGPPVTPHVTPGNTTAQHMGPAAARREPVAPRSSSSDEVICLYDDDHDEVVSRGTKPTAAGSGAAALNASKRPQDQTSAPDARGSGTPGSAPGVSTQRPDAAVIDLDDAEAGTQGTSDRGKGKAAISSRSKSKARAEKEDGAGAGAGAGAGGKGSKSKARAEEEDGAAGAGVAHGSSKRVRWSVPDPEVEVGGGISIQAAAGGGQTAVGSTPSGSKRGRGAGYCEDDDVVIVDEDGDVTVPQGQASAGAGTTQSSMPPSRSQQLQAPGSAAGGGTAAGSTAAGSTAAGGTTSTVMPAVVGAAAVRAQTSAPASSRSRKNDEDEIEIVAEVLGAGTSKTFAEWQDCVDLVEDRGKGKASTSGSPVVMDLLTAGLESSKQHGAGSNTDDLKAKAELERTKKRERELRRREQELAAQVAELERKLKEKEEQGKKAKNEDAAPEAPLPENWEKGRPAAGRVKLVYLPLPGQPHHPQVSQENIDELVYNGFTLEQATKALEASNDNPVAAITYAIQRLFSKSGESSQPQEDEAAKKRKVLEQEAQSVVTRFQAGMPGARVKAVARVQNPSLWTKFVIRKREVLDAHRGVQGELNEFLLWHGTDRASMQCILETGFDIRVANMNGAYGAGSYFAGGSTYSHTYSRKPPIVNAAMMVGPGSVPVGFPHLAGLPPSMLAAYSTFNASNSFAQALASSIGRQPPQPAAVATTVSTKRGRKSAKVVRMQTAAGATSSSHPAPAAAAAPGASNAAVHVSPVQHTTWPGKFSMMLCRVVLGTVGAGAPTMRKPPPGCDSVGSAATHGGQKLNDASVSGAIFAVFDNAQAYPEYIVHYEA